MIGETGLSIFRRLIDSDHALPSRGAAEAILELHFPEADQARIEELADKSNLGTLSQAEEQEYDGYIAAADVLAVWKSKARAALKRSAVA